MNILSSLNMPSYNWGEKIPRIFEYARWWLGEVNPFVMIGTAVALALALLAIIVGLFDRQSANDDDDDDDDDDAYDYRKI